MKWGYKTMSNYILVHLEYYVQNLRGGTAHNNLIIENQLRNKFIRSKIQAVSLQIDHFHNFKKNKRF